MTKTSSSKKINFSDFLKSHLTPSGFLKLALVILMLLFIICPVIAMFSNTRGGDFEKIFTNPTIGWATLYSILYSLCASAIAVILATFASFLMTRSTIKGKKIFSVLLTLPMLIPTISIGLGIRNIFGLPNCGFGTLVIGSVVAGFPVAYLLIYDALAYENKSVYDAALTLGIHKRVSFWKITLPYLKKPLINAFIATTVWIFTDYGLPIEVGGSIPTLPSYLYQEAVLLYQYGTGSVVGIILILPAIGSFIFNQLTKDSANEEVTNQIISPGKVFNTWSVIILILVTILISLPQIMFLVLGFTKNFPVDSTFTVEHFKNAFSPSSATNIWNRIWNSFLLSFLSGVFGSFFAYFGAYFSVRSKGTLSKIIDFIALISLAIPGLVLGLGFVSMFTFSKGWFYGTLTIMIVVNCAHFFGSPYLLAKNALSKLNKDYEIVGETINASKFKIFWNVLLPNSFSTVIEMFSYLFINSMITISAISFLAEYFNTPLSIEITRYSTTGNYSMQAVISIIILLINIIAKVGLQALSNAVEKKTRIVDDENISLRHNEFRILSSFKINNDKTMTRNEIVKFTKEPLAQINNALNELLAKHAIVKLKNGSFQITSHGDLLIKPYQVRRAIIIAAGFGSRMVPVTLDTPKPLVKVKGVRIIDTLLDALYAHNIKDIYIIRGYLGEQFDQLLEKYPTIQFIENPYYNQANNISSMFVAKDLINNCYICEADLIVRNPEIIRSYQYRSNYLGFKVDKTDDWCFHSKNGKLIDKVSVGGENVYQMVGISYWNNKDSAQLKIDIPRVYNSLGGKENYWDNVPLKHKKKNYQTYIRHCKKEDVQEIDNFSELVALDPSYNNYKSKHEK